MTLAQSFSETCAQFQSKVERLAEISGLETLQVYALWHKYSQQCEFADQSALLWEFVEWYKKDLGGDMTRLRGAF